MIEDLISMSVTAWTTQGAPMGICTPDCHSVTLSERSAKADTFLTSVLPGVKPFSVFDMARRGFSQCCGSGFAL